MRKRARISVPHPLHTIELWWEAQSSDAFIANSLPPLPSLAASGPAPPPSPPKAQDHTTSSTKTKKRKKRPPKPAPPRPRSLLAKMNENIRIQRRMRRTHAKFVAISAAAAAANSAGGEDGDSGDVPSAGPLAGLSGDVDVADDVEADIVDERPWPVPRLSRKSALEGSVDTKPDIGELAAENCIHWVNRKILEHVGFQGTFILLSHIDHSHKLECTGSSQLSLDMLSGITAEYLSNVGRTLRFYLDKYSNMMTSEVC
jgi:transcriptional activator SPT7